MYERVMSRYRDHFVLLPQNTPYASHVWLKALHKFLNTKQILHKLYLHTSTYIVWAHVLLSVFWWPQVWQTNGQTGPETRLTESFRFWVPDPFHPDGPIALSLLEGFFFSVLNVQIYSTYVVSHSFVNPKFLPTSNSPTLPTNFDWFHACYLITDQLPEAHLNYA